MDPILIERLERLNARFTGVSISVRVLDEPPLFLFRRRVEFKSEEMRLDLRFSKRDPLSDRIFWTAQSLFLESAFRANLNRMELYEDTRLFKSDAILAGAFLAEYACVIGTEWEAVIHARLIAREDDAKYDRQAGALLLNAGAFGLVPFDTGLEGEIGELVSVGNSRIYDRLSRVLEEIEIEAV